MKKYTITLEFEENVTEETLEEACANMCEEVSVKPSLYLVKETNETRKKDFTAIIRLKDGIERLGFEVANRTNDDDNSYNAIGKSLLSVVNKHTGSFDVIEDTVIAICGYGFDSLRNKVRQHKAEYEAIKW